MFTNLENKKIVNLYINLKRVHRKLLGIDFFMVYRYLNKKKINVYLYIMNKNAYFNIS